MKKIGILTFHRSHNCGSMLESYAIQNVIKKLGYKSELINFSSVGQRNVYKIFNPTRKIKKQIKNLILLPHYNKLKIIFNDYEQFMNKNLNVSKTDLSDYDCTEYLNEEYDAFVAGSDQIWNITIEDFNDIYFLNFVKDKKKIAYAPSFGSKDIMKYATDIEKYRDLINSFDYLSVREKNGQKWIKNLTNRDAELILDPTLLLDIEDYKRLEESSNIVGDYIFFYCPQYTRKLNIFVKKISKKYNLPVIVWNSKEFYLNAMYIYNFKITNHQNPGIYLDLIKNAKLVITTSFHGCIFSSLYKKTFWVLKNGGMYGDDDRVITLLDELGLSNRLIEPIFNPNFDYLKETNYQLYNQRLNKLKIKSMNYLTNALGSGEK